MKIIAEAELAAVVGPEDGEDVVERAERTIMSWILDHFDDCRVGDRIIIIRDLNA